MLHLYYSCVNNDILFWRGFQRPALRKYLAMMNGYKCAVCNLSEWRNQELVLIVDHIDGNAGNNKPDNLRLLCPNCNSQTTTFGEEIGERDERQEGYH